MRVYELMNQVDFQVEVHFQWYNFETDEIIPLTEKEANDKEIKYMWADRDEIYIEVEMEE